MYYNITYIHPIEYIQWILYVYSLITYEILRYYDIPLDFHFNRSDEYITTNTEPTL